MPFAPRLLAVVAALVSGGALAQAMPPAVSAALARANVPPSAVAVLVTQADGKAAARLSHRAELALNPASVMKLVTTYAALDLLGPAYNWRTPVFVEGAVREGTLYGNLYIQGRGDPKLVSERLWLLLRRVQGLGIDKISGDIVLDGSAFEAIDADPARFDGEALRPYNATPEALLLNFKSVIMTFVPDTAAHSAAVQFEPALAGVQLQRSVPLSSAGCGDYRALLKADFSEATRIRFAGAYPASCGEKVWPVAYADPGTFNRRVVAGMWRDIGGALGGTVREGRVPAPSGVALTPVFEVASPPLAEIIRDINKHSNNVMAQQLFLSLSLGAPDSGDNAAPPASRAASRGLLQRWWLERIGSDDAPLLDNGSGLSRQERISAQALGRLLQHAYRSPLMPELMASLPVVGIDGTLKRSQARAQGSAHLKTGSLRDVLAVAGYVHAASGKRFCLVVIVNHANANAARPAIDALIDWAEQDS